MPFYNKETYGAIWLAAGNKLIYNSNKVFSIVTTEYLGMAFLLPVCDKSDMITNKINFSNWGTIKGNNDILNSSSFRGSLQIGWRLPTENEAICLTEMIKKHSIVEKGKGIKITTESGTLYLPFFSSEPTKGRIWLLSKNMLCYNDKYECNIIMPNSIYLGAFVMPIRDI